MTTADARARAGDGHRAGPEGRRQASPATGTGSPPAVQRLLALQRAAGNAAVCTLLGAGPGRAVQRDEVEEGQPEPPRPWRYELTPPSLLTPPAPNWGLYSSQFRGRDLVLGKGEEAVISEHYRRWLPLAEAIHGVPGVGRLKSTAEIMESFTGSMIDSSLSGDHPTALERFNLEDERLHGVSTTTLPLFSGSF